jgi:hypothetical protein
MNQERLSEVAADCTPFYEENRQSEILSASDLPAVFGLSNKSDDTVFVREHEICDKEGALKTLRVDGMQLRFVASFLRADKEVVAAAAFQNGWSLQFASPLLKVDIDIIRVAISQVSNNIATMREITS